MKAYKNGKYIYENHMEINKLLAFHSQAQITCVSQSSPLNGLFSTGTVES